MIDMPWTILDRKIHFSLQLMIMRVKGFTNGRTDDGTYSPGKL